MNSNEVRSVVVELKVLLVDELLDGCALLSCRFPMATGSPIAPTNSITYCSIPVLKSHTDD